MFVCVIILGFSGGWKEHVFTLTRIFLFCILNSCFLMVSTIMVTHMHTCTLSEQHVKPQAFFKRAERQHPFSQSLCHNASTHTHTIRTRAWARARALTRSSLVVSSFGIQLHPQSTRPPSRSRREQSTYADSGCGAQHSGKKGKIKAH